jgi:hypothetical protein
MQLKDMPLCALVVSKPTETVHHDSAQVNQTGTVPIPSSVRFPRHHNLRLIVWVISRGPFRPASAESTASLVQAWVSLLMASRRLQLVMEFVRDAGGDTLR